MISECGRGAVLYDGLLVRGGAEQVTVTLARELGAELICAGLNQGMFSEEELPPVWHALSGRLPRHPGLRLLHGARMFRTRAALLCDFDWAVYSGSTAPLAALRWNPPRSFYYCHALPRFIYDLRQFYLERAPHYQRPVLHALSEWLQPRFEAAVSRIDTLIANSENVRERIRRYLGREAVVVHPPCDVTGYRWVEEGDYFLSTARLEPYKRVDLVIQAFLRMPDRKLVVASGGSEEIRLRRLAGEARNIRFVGWQSAAALRQLVGRAFATIYIPRDEDFGISPVESMAAGKPVLGVAEGGLLETLRADQTGILLPPSPSVADLVEAVRRLDRDTARSMRAACERRAGLFGQDRFVSRMHEMVANSC